MLSHTGFLFDIDHQHFVAWVIDHDLIHQSEQKELQPRGKTFTPDSRQLMMIMIMGLSM
jgi:hypothetical protein